MRSAVFFASAAALYARGALSESSSSAGGVHGLGQWIMQGMGGYSAPEESTTSSANSTTAQPTASSSSATSANATAAHITSAGSPSHVAMVMGDLTYDATLISSGSVAVLPFTRLTVGGPAANIGKATVSLCEGGIVVEHAGKTSTAAAAYGQPTANASQAATPATDATHAVDLKDEVEPTHSLQSSYTAGSTQAANATAGSAQATGSTQGSNSTADSNVIDLTVGRMTYPVKIISSVSAAVLPFTTLSIGGPEAVIGKATVSLGDSGLVVVHGGKTSTAPVVEASVTSPAPTAAPTESAKKVVVSLGNLVYTADLVSSGSVVKLPHGELTLGGEADRIGKATLSLGPSGVVVVLAGETSTASFVDADADATASSPAPTAAPTESVKQAVVSLGDLVYTAELLSSGSVAKLPHGELTLGGEADRIGKATLSLGPSGIVVAHAGETSTAAFT